MVHHCIDNQLPIGVCHTEKRLSEGRKKDTLEEALNSNQDTYKPHRVFSAGDCELVKTLDDGRLLINVFSTERYQAIEEIQTLPFLIYACEPLPDELPDEEAMQMAGKLQTVIIDRLKLLLAGRDQAEKTLDLLEWEEKDPVLFGYELMSILDIDADMQQSVLEMISVVDRLETIRQILVSV